MSNYEEGEFLKMWTIVNPIFIEQYVQHCHDKTKIQWSSTSTKQPGYFACNAMSLGKCVAMKLWIFLIIINTLH